MIIFIHTHATSPTAHLCLRMRISSVQPFCKPQRTLPKGIIGSIDSDIVKSSQGTQKYSTLQGRLPSTKATWPSTVEFEYVATRLENESPVARPHHAWIITLHSSVQGIGCHLKGACLLLQHQCINEKNRKKQKSEELISKMLQVQVESRDCDWTPLVCCTHMSVASQMVSTTRMHTTAYCCILNVPSAFQVSSSQPTKP